MELKFVIPGDPKAEARHRSMILGGKVHTYEPVDSKNQKAFIKYIVLHEMQKINWVKTEEPIAMDIVAHIRFTKNVTKKFKEAALAGKEWPTKKPDVDNMAKLLQDACNDLVYVDDKQIVELHVRKIYDNEAYTEVKIKEL